MRWYTRMNDNSLPLVHVKKLIHRFAGRSETVRGLGPAWRGGYSAWETERGGGPCILTRKTIPSRLRWILFFYTFYRDKGSNGHLPEGIYNLKLEIRYSQ